MGGWVGVNTPGTRGPQRIRQIPPWLAVPHAAAGHKTSGGNPIVR